MILSVSHHDMDVSMIRFKMKPTQKRNIFLELEIDFISWMMRQKLNPQ